MANVRWMIRRDLDAVLAIDKASYDDAYREPEFIKMLRKRNQIGMVAEDHNDKVVGFMVYALFKRRIDVLRLAVAPQYSGMGVGTSLIDKLKSKLSHKGRSRVCIGVSEQDTGTHLFLKSCGFRATKVHRDGYGRNHDSYDFEYRHKELAKK